MSVTFEQALGHHQAGRLDEAEAGYREILRADPGNADALNNLGQIYEFLDRMDDAIDAYRKAVAAVPGFAPALANLGQALLAKGEAEEAVDCLEGALKAFAGDPDVLGGLGRALAAVGRTDEAVSHLRRARDMAPEDPALLCNLGTALLANGDLPEAEAAFEAAVALEEGLAEAHNGLGKIHRKMERLDDSIASHQKALELDPDFPEAHDNLGTVYQILGRLDDARASFRKAITLRPDFPEAHFNLHTTLYGDADLEPAAECLEAVLKIAPEDMKTRFYLGVLRDYQGQPEKAARQLDSLPKDVGWFDCRLDSWNYIKSVPGPVPRLFGTTSEVLRFGFEAAEIDGLVLEFGVFRGTSIRQIAAQTDQDVHGFDTFQGLPEVWHDKPVGTYTAQGQLPEVPGNVQLHVGLFEDTLAPFLEQHAGPIRYMNVDCDLYTSTKTVLDLLSERIVPGTVIVFDEYLANPHWREDEFKAFQEAVKRYTWQYGYLAFSLHSKQAVVVIR